MPHVEILFGSKSDLKFLKGAPELTQQLEEAGISFAVSVCSAHRNAKELGERIDQTIDTTAVYICAAGMAAALPGAVKALLLGRSLATVIGIALPSDAYPDGQDAEISIKRLPPGIDVVYGGVGMQAIDTIGDTVVALATQYKPNPDSEELEAIRANIKPPQFDINLEEM